MMARTTRNDGTRPVVVVFFVVVAVDCDIFVPVGFFDVGKIRRARREYERKTKNDGCVSFFFKIFAPLLTIRTVNFIFVSGGLFSFRC